MRGSLHTLAGGDYVIAFSTAIELRSNYRAEAMTHQTEVLRDERLSPLFQAVKEATEEAVINSLLQAKTTTGHRGRTVTAIDPGKVEEICHRHDISATD